MGGVATTADVHPSAVVHSTVKIWGLAQIREEAHVGPGSIVGRGAYVGVGVRVGSRVKIQNYALLYEPAVVEDGAFIGPGVILTNDRSPRAVRADGALKGAEDWHSVGVHVGRGAALGAGTVCVAPVRIGEWAMVGAGSVVTRDVQPYSLVIGTPARRVGWVGRAGVRLERGPDGDCWRCPETGETFREDKGVLYPDGGSP